MVAAVYDSISLQRTNEEKKRIDHRESASVGMWKASESQKNLPSGRESVRSGFVSLIRLERVCVSVCEGWISQIGPQKLPPRSIISWKGERP